MLESAGSLWFADIPQSVVQCSERCSYKAAEHTGDAPFGCGCPAYYGTGLESVQSVESFHNDDALVLSDNRTDNFLAGPSFDEAEEELISVSGEELDDFPPEAGASPDCNTKVGTYIFKPCIPINNSFHNIRF